MQIYCATQQQIPAAGVGRQTFTGGGGVLYGSVFSGGSLVVADFSAARDVHIDSPVVSTLNADGSRTYVPAPGTKAKVGMGFKISPAVGCPATMG